MSNQTEWWAPTSSGADDPVDGVPTPSRRARSTGRARAARQRKQRRNRSIVVVVMALALVVGAGYIVVSLIGGLGDDKGQSTAEQTDFPGPGVGEASVVIKQGDTGAAMGRTLADAGVVATSQAFAKAFAANPDAPSIQPGTYKLLQQMKATDAVAALLNPASRQSMRVTLAEGLTADQIMTKISEKTLIPIDDLKKAAKDTDAIGLPSQAKGKLEGWLYAATYDVEPDASATDVLTMLVGKTVDVLESKKVPKDQWETVLNKASMVEREAKRAEDRPKMARVIDSRLEQNWALGIDAAVAYGAGVPGTALTKAETQDPSNPYNLYIHKGLPPTPISSPSEASIDAVLKPADGDWMYWCAVNLDTGETVFSVDQTGQDAAQAKLKAWLAKNGG
ncbi:endolytic transglycosylase MltG [Cellulomonas sp. HZM]|uniref:endolytic transglycosylase MltG n=1 Tax=Cellulomonas sp. HZM TaxID=1454010 RepID=UPI000493350B|nr:endolytic transglycosylase MltG [Cellulomonas sp. HZM]